jgi:hypothetical protein
VGSRSKMGGVDAGVLVADSRQNPGVFRRTAKCCSF